MLKFTVKYSFNVFIFLALIFNASILCAKEQQDSTPLSSKTPFISRTLTIAINETSSPYHFVDAQGKAAGLMPDLWRLWADKQQVSIEFVTLPWIETLEQVGEGKVDIHGGLSIIDSRKEELGFSRSLFPIYTHIYVNSDLMHVKDIDDLSPYTIGVVNGSAHIDLLTKKYPKLEKKTFSTRHELYKAAINKEILAFAGLEKLPNNYQYYQQLSAMYPAHKRLRYKQSDYGVAVAKSNKSLLEFIELGLARISLIERANLERKWLGMQGKIIIN